jgi:hypothetical protein
MKKLASIIAILASTLMSGAYGCDEQCLKEQAETLNNKEFPSYLTWAYCDDIRMEFMTTTMRSLESYKEKNLNPKFKGGLRNTKNFIDQRKEWLQECDQYLSMTKKKRIFEDDKATDEIFGAMDSVTKELAGLIAGVRYDSAVGDDSSTVTRDKFDRLFKTVDDHKTLMHLKGKYVFR